MKIFEREEMIRRDGIEEGRREEQRNTEKERKRAETAEDRAKSAEEEIRRLRALLDMKS